MFNWDMIKVQVVKYLIIKHSKMCSRKTALKQFYFNCLIFLHVMNYKLFVFVS